MNYARFIELRKPIWDEFESTLAWARANRVSVGHAALETMALLYRQVLHDHALASARFPATGAAQRLQRLALEGTRFLQRDRGEAIGGPIQFFTRAFPRAFRGLRAELLTVVPLFLLATVAGLAMAAVQPEVGSVFLGRQAMERLQDGQLWTDSLVATVPPGVSASAIATNNVAVALTGWAGGALAGLGSLYVVVLNGFMLGALIGVTAHYSLHAALLSFVVAHGMLEITLILITAAAGLALGRALVVSDDRPRAELLAEAGKRSLTVVLGCAPWFVVLAVVEAFVSPAPSLPWGIKAVVGASLETLFLLAATAPFAFGRGHE